MKKGTQSNLGELAQAKLRLAMHFALVALTLWAYSVDPRIALDWVIILCSASIVSAITLYAWAYTLRSSSTFEKTRFAQRIASIVNDNIFISLTLWIGGETTAGVWGVYLWISIGYGMRFGVLWMRANVVASLFSFWLVIQFTPFWSSKFAFAVGLAAAMTVVPLYTGWLIRQLHAAVKERENAYAERSQFLARMSHELRTPLHAIVTTTDLLKPKLRDAEARDLINLIATSSSTLLGLINNVLDLSRFESGNSALQAEPINLHRTVIESAGVVLPQATSKELELNVYLDPKIEPLVFGDSEQLKEVLVNLMGNAVKFTAEGEIAIAVTLVEETDTEIEALFEIRDTGDGIPKEKLKTIMDPFVQADTSTTRQYGGTGLGTAFAREIIRAMGGTISIVSELGSGTTVSVQVPFTKQQRSPQGFAELGMSVMLVTASEDADDLASTIRRLGVETRVARDPDDAMEWMNSSGLDGPVSGVIVDVDDFGEKIPAVVRRLRRSSGSRIFPICAIGRELYRSVAISSGCLTFACRPLSDLLLRRIMEEFAELQHTWRPDSDATVDLGFERNLKLLVADDDPTNRKMLATVLENAGHSVRLTENGEEALTLLITESFDAAILDMHMPKRDGLEVVALYKASSYALNRAIPILLFTADATLETKREAERVGADAFITKPIRPNSLLRSLYKTVDSLEGGSYDALEARPSENVSRLPVVGNTQQTAASESESEWKIREEDIADLLCFMTKDETRQFFGDFCEDAEKYIARFADVDMEIDVDVVRRDMHSLAGAAFTIGAVQLAEIARDIEKQDVTSIMRNRAELVERIKRVCRETIEEIDDRYIASNHT